MVNKSMKGYHLVEVVKKDLPFRPMFSQQLAQTPVGSNNRLGDGRKRRVKLPIPLNFQDAITH